MTTNYIDAKFKDTSPVETVKNIQAILSDLGITMQETHHLSGLENCHSYTISAENTALASNGKGITDDFSRASAYGEFIERLQCGLFFYKYQSLYTDPAMNLQTHAPDGKYMTVEELEENGQWMDHIIEEYGHGLTRKKLAQQCLMYACSEDGKILTVPYYSLFEDKYVYIPVGFAEQLYSANGCCAGNTREEALVHALSEIMERRCNISVLLSGKAAPVISKEVLRTFPTVSKILKRLDDEGIFDVTVFDFSTGNGFPVVATRIINKKTHTYLMNTAADPILEIAVQRTLTEIFQGRHIENFRSAHSGRILTSLSDVNAAHNVLNLLETGNGLYALDFFAQEEACERPCTNFDDNRALNNKALLSKLLNMYKGIGKPIYMRNNAFLGFPCYKVIIPGFSESRGLNLIAPVQEYAMGHQAAQVLRRPAAAGPADLMMLLMFHNQISDIYSRYSHFGRLAGLPLKGDCNRSQLFITMAYAAYKLNRTKDAVRYLDMLLRSASLSEQDTDYFECVKQYLELSKTGIEPEKVRSVLKKFHTQAAVAQLYVKLEQKQTPFDGWLTDCRPGQCEGCVLQNSCSYIASRDVITAAGQRYAAFQNGQARENFPIGV